MKKKASLIMAVIALGIVLSVCIYNNSSNNKNAKIETTTVAAKKDIKTKDIKKDTAKQIKNKKENKKKIDNLVNDMEKELQSEVKENNKNTKTIVKNKNNNPSDVEVIEDSKNDDGWSPMIKVER